MRCEEARQRIAVSRYGDDAADGSQRDALAAHLARCEACSRVAARERALDAALATDTGQAPPPGFDARFFARLRDERGRRDRPKLGARWAWTLVPVAAGVAIALVQRPPEPPRQVPRDDLALAMELELVEDLPLLQQLDEVEAYEVLSQLDEDELDALVREVSP